MIFPHTISDLPYTYTGLLDDVMLRYSRTYAGEDFFNKIIAKNLFFGGGILFNDGYLVNHPVSRRHLQIDDSILRVMINSNFIRILTRSGDSEALSRMPEVMAASGNEEYRRLVASNEWPELRGLLRRISANAFRTKNALSWPKRDMSYGYAKLIERVMKKKDRPSELGLKRFSASDLARIEDAFLGQNPLAGNPRHKFEKACLKVAKRANGRETAIRRMAEIIDIGNQAYHYNFGLCLTGSIPEKIAVDTTWGYAFDELLAESEIERGQLDDIPVLQVPQDTPFEDGALFLPFLDPASKVGEAKLAYLMSLSLLLRPGATSLSDRRKDVVEATKDYHASIKQLFSKRLGSSHIERMLGAPIMLAVGSLDVGGAGHVRAAAAPIAGMAVDIVEQGRVGRHSFLVNRFKLRKDTASMNPTPDRLVRIKDIRPHIASLAFNETEATNFIADLPIFERRP